MAAQPPGASASPIAPATNNTFPLMIIAFQPLRPTTTTRSSASPAGDPQSKHAAPSPGTILTNENAQCGPTNKECARTAGLHSRV